MAPQLHHPPGESPPALASRADHFAHARRPAARDRELERQVAVGEAHALHRAHRGRRSVRAQERLDERLRREPPRRGRGRLDVRAEPLARVLREHDVQREPRRARALARHRGGRGLGVLLEDRDRGRVPGRGGSTRAHETRATQPPLPLRAPFAGPRSHPYCACDGRMCSNTLEQSTPSRSTSTGAWRFMMNATNSAWSMMPLLSTSISRHTSLSFSGSIAKPSCSAACANSSYESPPESSSSNSLNEKNMPLRATSSVSLLASKSTRLPASRSCSRVMHPSGPAMVSN